MTTPENEVEPDESSGVTTLRPMPAKPARLFELAEGDSTAYFSASELLERGKALAAQPSEPPLPQAVSIPEEAAPRAGWFMQFRRASFARKASAILLPVLCVLLLAKPRVDESARPAASQPRAASAAPAAPTQAQPALPPTSASSASLELPRGVTAAHAAADSVASGDYSRAAKLYRELSQREPQNQAYREAARILSKPAQARTP